MGTTVEKTHRLLFYARVTSQQAGSYGRVATATRPKLLAK